MHTPAHRAPDPVAHLASLLGPWVGLRMRRPIAVALRASFTVTMPSSGAVIVRRAQDEQWSVEPFRPLAMAHAARRWSETDHRAFVERVR
jgi:hypothetical protein